jgi:hypothetical protein
MQITSNMDELSSGIRDPRISAVFRVWQESRQSRFVHLADMPWDTIPNALPLIYLIEVPPRKKLKASSIRYIFVGEIVAKSLGIDATGMTIAEVLARPAAESFRLAIDGLLRDPCILHSLHVNHLPNVTEVRTERLVLPISDNDNGIEAFCVAFSTLERSPLNRLHEKSDAREAWPETLRKLRL